MLVTYYRIAPPGNLAEIVRSYWVVEGSGVGSVPFVHRTLADCRAELIFYYRGGFKRYLQTSAPQKTFVSGLYGPTRHFTRFETGDDFGIFGVELYPYALLQLFSIPAVEFSDNVVDLKSLLGRCGETLEERMVQASDNQARAALVSSLLSSQMAITGQLRFPAPQVLKQIIDSHRMPSIDDLLSEFPLSRRQSERKLRELTGFSPGLFLRIARFNSVIDRPKKGRSLTQLGYECGYFDQSHFIRDFSGFSGYTPGEFFRHVPAPDTYKSSADFKR